VDEHRHLRLSLVQVAVFLAAGLWLEAMYGLRAEGWMDDDLRREFLRLGHAHGALLGVLNLAIAWAMHRLDTPESWARPIRIATLLGALLVGLGFFGGGLWHAPTDPGPLVLVVPAGAMMLLASCLAIAIVRARN
jgi:peptidoglycan/LPS O-acetylase OafA/YrhL